MRDRIATSLIVLTLLATIVSTGGCMLIDLAVDPVGCGVGSHEPIFPWYPAYLWNPQLRAYGQRWKKTRRKGERQHP